MRNPPYQWDGLTHVLAAALQHRVNQIENGRGGGGRPKHHIRKCLGSRPSSNLTLGHFVWDIGVHDRFGLSRHDGRIGRGCQPRKDQWSAAFRLGRYNQLRPVAGGKDRNPNLAMPKKSGSRRGQKLWDGIRIENGRGGGRPKHIPEMFGQATIQQSDTWSIRLGYWCS